MRIAFCVLLFIAVASAQIFGPFSPRHRRPPPPQRGGFIQSGGGFRGGNSGGFRGGSSGGFRGGSSGGRGGVPVDNTIGNTQYHYSWRHTGHAKYTYGQAAGYCRGLGAGWNGISITDGRVSSMVSSALQRERIEYIWTSGQRSGSGWRWAQGSFSPLNWSHTGGARRPQPDNRDGNESCLAVLNNFYQDGVKWHDVGCEHRKPIICQLG